MGQRFGTENIQHRLANMPRSHQFKQVFFLKVLATTNINKTGRRLQLSQGSPVKNASGLLR